MATVFWLIILIIDIVVLLDIIRSNKDFEKKILWTIAVILLPVLGPILYYVMGKK
ncbi:MAG: PLD nuclease N-terminal domain-containing protein [Cyclobacteriaceae bacterium]|nr:PLD nuclease N-terminal domain-containing protein [Cyclobacteriaceae bacterium]MDH4298430.1 PLD nuclease N-terminal domain-containing protein [Cyclobacteriaceae bacterium]MDH5251441.1 PLD nuclease N-terminal domain-containing protein [Cyclobacteriaceae bacterium]